MLCGLFKKRSHAKHSLSRFMTKMLRIRARLNNFCIFTLLLLTALLIRSPFEKNICKLLWTHLFHEINNIRLAQNHLESLIL